MAERSAAQKRATSALVRMNKARRSGSKRSGGSRGGSGRGFGLRRSRRAAVEWHTLPDVAGGTSIAYGLLANGNAGGKGGQSVIGQLRAGSVSGIPSAIGSTWQSLKQSGTMTQKQVLGGAAVVAGGRFLKAIAPSLHRIKFRFGKWGVRLTQASMKLTLTLDADDEAYELLKLLFARPKVVVPRED